MKTKNIIQRLCLFLFVLVLALPALATNYGREGYEIFRSRDLGKHQTVTTLRKGKVEITFSSCTTSGSSGNSAIYQPAKGSRITVKADDRPEKYGGDNTTTARTADTLTAADENS